MCIKLCYIVQYSISRNTSGSSNDRFNFPPTARKKNKQNVDLKIYLEVLNTQQVSQEFPVQDLEEDRNSKP